MAHRRLLNFNRGSSFCPCLSPFAHHLCLALACCTGLLSAHRVLAFPAKQVINQSPTSPDSSYPFALSQVCHATTGDADLDGDVDLDDLTAAWLCLDASGPGTSATFACQTFDADTDADTDFADTADLLNAFTASATGGLFQLTLGNDFIGGTPGSDHFVANLAFHAPSNALIPTLQNDDDLFGGPGIDTLSATLNLETLTYVYPDFYSVENVEIIDVGTAPTFISLQQEMQTCQLITRGSTNPHATSFWQLELIDAAMLEHEQGMSLLYVPEATFGASDVQFLRLFDTTGGVFTIESTTANGVERLDIESTGTSNTLDAVAQLVGNTMTEVRVAGDAPLEITQPLPSTVNIVDARDSFGGVSVDVSAFTGATTTLGGMGDDTFILNGGYMPQDIVDGGDGFDTLVINASTAAGAVQPQPNVTNIEALAITDTVIHDIDATTFSSVSRLQFLNGASLINPFNPGMTVIVQEDTTIEFNSGTDSTAAIYFEGRGAEMYGGAKSMSILLNDHDCFQLHSLLIDEIHLQSNGRLDGGPADANVNVLFGDVAMSVISESKLLVNGATNLDFMDEVRVSTLDARNFTGRLRLFAQSPPNQAAGPGTIYGGTGNDTLNVYGFRKSVDAGPGHDVVDGTFFNGIVTLGPGTDTFRVAPGSTFNRITDFVPGFTGEIINIDRDDIGTLEGTNNFASENAIQEHDYPQDLIIFTQPEVVRVTSATVPAFSGLTSENGTNLLAAIGGTISTFLVTSQYLILVEDDAGNTGVFFAQSGFDTTISAGELQLILILENVAVTDLVYSNFTNLN